MVLLKLTERKDNYHSIEHRVFYACFYKTVKVQFIQLDTAEFSQTLSDTKSSKMLKIHWTMLLYTAHCICKFIHVVALLPHGKIWGKKGFSYRQFCQLSYFFFILFFSILHVQEQLLKNGIRFFNRNCALPVTARLWFSMFQ